MTDLMKELYFAWTDKQSENTPESQKALETFCICDDIEAASEREGILLSALSAEMMLAFEAGFKTAAKFLKE